MKLAAISLLALFAAAPAQAVTVTFKGTATVTEFCGPDATPCLNNGLTGPYELVFSTDNSFVWMNINDERLFTFTGPVNYGVSFTPGPVYRNENYSVISAGAWTETEFSSASITVIAFKYGAYGSPPSFVGAFDATGVNLFDWFYGIDFSSWTLDADGNRIYTHYMRVDPSPGTVSVAAVPLPAALPLLGLALAGLGFYGWRRS